MAVNRVADMTIEELRAMIEEIVDERLKIIPRQSDSRTLQEIMDSIERNRITPPPGAKSSLELLREDRDR